MELRIITSEGMVTLQPEEKKQGCIQSVQRRGNASKHFSSQDVMQFTHLVCLELRKRYPQRYLLVLATV